MKPPILTVSDDGYIRLSFTKLHNFPFTHLLSGLDSENDDSVTAGASQSSITGYTEWLSDSAPQITIGWDWEMYFANSKVCLRRISEPRSNLMLLDASNNDIGYEKSTLLQEMFIDGLQWQPIVLEQINVRYR
jgi:hypothetical protein